MVNTTFALAALLTMAAPVQDSTNLAWKPKLNEVIKYQFSMNIPIDMGGTPGTVDVGFVSVSKVVGLDAELVTMEGSMDSFKIKINGQEMDMSQMGGPAPDMSGTVKIVTKLNGEVVSDSTPAEMGGGEGMQRMNAFYRPGKMVKVGDSWEQEWKADKAKGLQSAKARWTLKGEEMSNGVACWKVDYVFAEMDTADGMSANGSLWINKMDGHMESLKYQFNNVSMSEMMPKSNGTGSAYRVR